MGTPTMTAPGQWLASRNVHCTEAGCQPPAPSATVVSTAKGSCSSMHRSRLHGTCSGGDPVRSCCGERDALPPGRQALVQQHMWTLQGTLDCRVWSFCSAP